MGVQGLWQLLQPAGKAVSLDSLEGKILAVDISIWLHQATKGMRDRDGNPLPNAHLQTLFSRVCKLLFYKIKPVFVFDGGVPVLKKQTMASRRQKKEEAEQQSDKVTQKLLHNLIHSEAIKNALGQNQGGASAANIARIKSRAKGEDMFELPPLPEMDKESTGGLNFEEDEAWEERMNYQNAIQGEYQHLDEIDLESEEFRSLPGEIKHEILTEMKEVRKQRRLGRAVPMPEDAGDFSSFQMSRLMKQSKLTNHIEAVRKEMNVRNTADFSQAISSEYMAGEFETHRVVSEDSSHYVLIKGLSKRNQLEQAAKCEDIVASIDKEAINTAKSEEERKQFEEPDDLLLDSDKEKEIKEAPADVSRNDCCINIGPDLFEGSKDYSSASEVDDGDVNNKVVILPSTEEQTESKCEIQDPTNANLTSSLVNESKSVKYAADLRCMKRKGGGDVGEEGTPKISKVTVPAESTAVQDVSGPTETTQESESDDEGFIEISVDPSNVKQDELFPAEMFDVDQTRQEIEDKTERSSSVPPTSNGASALEVPEVPDEMENISDAEENQLLRSEEPSERLLDQFDIGDYQLDETDEEALLSEQKTEEEEEKEEGEEEEGEEEEVRKPSEEFKGMTEEDLLELQDELESEVSTLQSERRLQQRLATSITEQMNVEAQELLSLFGIPYIVSPMEAEAQCAQLDLLGLTQGTITDDSDIWLFGGRKVYRNFFNQKKSIESYGLASIETQFGLDREKMILIAYLCGSDYTDGIKGVGPVTALEILGEFPAQGIDGLYELKSWWDEAQAQERKSVSSRVKNKIREMEIQEGFPNPAVKDAYLNPAVEESNESFSWSSPDLDLLRDYAKVKLGWDKNKTDEMVVPVLKQLNKKESQPKINSYFQPEYFMEPSKIVSKRMKQALNKVRGAYNPSSPQMETNDDKLQKANKILDLPQGRVKGRGRGRGKGKGRRVEVKVKDEVNLSESSSSDEGGFIREENEHKTKKVKGKGKGKGKNRVFEENLIQ